MNDSTVSRLSSSLSGVRKMLTIPKISFRQTSPMTHNFVMSNRSRIASQTSSGIARKQTS